MANPVGEDSWLAYIDETARNATDLEQRVNVVELYKRAVGEEPGSLRLWLAYCNYFRNLWESSNSSDADWTEEEQELGREVFSFGAALDLWQQGYEAIQYRLSDSHEFWDRWISFEMEQFTKSQTSEGVRRITHLYRDRLATPHLTWDDTSQALSSFLSQYNQPAWEQTMQETTAVAQNTKKAIKVRDPFELKLKQAQRNDDVEAQKAHLRDYLDWEVRGLKMKKSGVELTIKLCSGLFDRALTGLFATDEDAWHDYIVSLSSETSDFQSSAGHLLDASRRSVQHCPWSGRLWSRYILCAEEAKLSFAEVESIKHAATSDSQLYKNGMESMIDMYVAWCAFLKRTALAPDATEEAADVAEVGLRAAIEDVEITGKRLYGKDFQGDPKYRLQRIYIQHLTEKKGAIGEARAQWKKLERSPIHAKSYDFWFNYYMWEMLIFSSGQQYEGNTGNTSLPDSLRVPTAATAVLYSAATQKTIDWPERVLEVYLQHCHNYELPASVRQADDFVHKTQKILTYRRKREEEQQAAQYAAYYESQAQAQAQVEAAQVHEQSAAEATASPNGPKRKRGSIADAQEESAENSSKRQRNGEQAAETSGQVPQRDRENSTIVVTNLPFEVTQGEVRKYFKPYGHINNITAFVKEADEKSTTALIEFGTTEEARSALLRDAKYFGESQITVQPGYDLTVYVANYPPAADEKFIRDLFQDCGDILSIRWPSLKVNTHRRFCYISFRNRDASAKAVAKEGKLLEGKYSLLAKYSDPSRKKNREGAIAEGREVHVSNLDRHTTEADIRAVFGKFGTVTRVNIPFNMAGKSRGFAFLDFETKEHAAKAVEELNNTKFKSQILQVEISKENKVKPSARTTDFQRTSASPAPSSLKDHEGDATMGDAENSPQPSSSEIAARTIALMGLPDTVNDARVKALVEPIGSIIKLVHQPGHGGAIIEFADAATAGKAALQLDSMEYEGHKLRTGSPDELRQSKPDNQKPSAKGHSKPKGLMAPPQATRRAVLGKAGPKRGLGFAPRATTAGSGGGESKTENGQGKAKSNADFKAMFLAGKKDENTEKKEVTDKGE